MKTKLLFAVAIILITSVLTIFATNEKDEIVVGQAKIDTLSLFSGDNQTAKLTKALPNAIKIVVQDQNGVVVTNTEVKFETTDGTVSQSSVKTDANGIAAVNWTLANSLGVQILNVSAFDADGITALKGSPLTVNATAICIEVGDEYAGGIVFYVDGNCCGLVCAKIDQNSGNEMAWADQQNSITGATGTAVGTGQSNTPKIVSHVGTNMDYVARTCDELDLEGYTDWFLPSKDELNVMYQNLHKASPSLGDFQNDFYWSSTEDDGGDAWLQEFDSYGDQNYDAKDALHRVRAVRIFTN